MSSELLEAATFPSPALAAGAAVRWLVDNAQAYDALLAAIGSARRSAWLSQLAFDADCAAYDASDGHVGSERRLIDALIEAHVARDLDVRVLLNESVLLDTAKALRAFLADAGARGVQVRGIGHFPQLLHAKVVVIDGIEAFLVGSPFANGYWDDARHRPVDARRPLHELGGRPLHDVSCAITGTAVAALASQFAELWNEVSIGPHPVDILPRPAQKTDDGPIGVVRTTPRRVLSAHPGGMTEILSAIQMGLATARRLVYIEHQYLSARPVVDALTDALAREPALEVIAVLNQNPDVTAYRGWQNARLREARLLDHPRVGVFALWSAERSAVCGTGPRWEVSQIFVHSKVLLVDDLWATVGSANLDGVSLHSYGDDFAGRPGRRIFRHVRNFDVNVTLDDRGGLLEGAVHELRVRLWTEHLGVAAARLNAEPATGGWLGLWRECAARNLARLAGDRPAPSHGSLVLPYRTRSTPRAQLAELGVDLERVRLHFNPSWLDVHCSASWVRNVFP